MVHFEEDICIVQISQEGKYLLEFPARLSLVAALLSVTKAKVTRILRISFSFAASARNSVLSPILSCLSHGPMA